MEETEQQISKIKLGLDEAFDMLVRLIEMGKTENAIEVVRVIQKELKRRLS